MATRKRVTKTESPAEEPVTVVQVTETTPFTEKLKSRKFIMAVVGALLTIGNAILDKPLDDQTMTLLQGGIAAYIFGEGIADLGGRG